MLTRIVLIYCIINIFLITLTISTQKQHGPSGLDENEMTTCDEFSKYARFNPYSVLNSKWMVFYYWGPPQNIIVYKFYVPGEKETAYLKKLMEVSVREAINWTAKFVLMKEKSNNTCLLVERDDRGAYDLYELYTFELLYGSEFEAESFHRMVMRYETHEYRKGQILEPVDVRIKQTGDNLYIGIMLCKAEVVYALSKLRDVPHKKNIQDAAARLGYRGRGGKSFLYQGHQWMPIPEADDIVYWKRRGLKDW